MTADRMIRWCLAALVYIFGTTATTAVAEDAEEKTNLPLNELPADKMSAAASELVQSINRAVAEVRALQSSMLNSSAEDSLVFELQIFQLQQHFLDELHDLSQALLKLEESSPRAELRPQVESLSSMIIAPLHDTSNTLRKEIDDVRARRAKASAGEQDVIEDDLQRLTHRLDRTLQATNRHLDDMRLLELDVTVAQEAFEKLCSERAKELAGRIELALNRLKSHKERIKTSPEDADTKLLLRATETALNTNTESMEVTLQIMEELHLETAPYRALMITATQDISSGLLERGVARRLLEGAAETTSAWFKDNGARTLVKLLLFLGILLLFHMLARLVRLGLQKLLTRSTLSVSQLARRMIISTATNTVRLLGLLVALSQLGVSLGPLLAGLGVAGFVIGFALQDTLGNFAAGVMILLYRPYDLGDLVDIAGAFGKVNKMSLVSTTILTVDNQTLVVPNNQIWGNVIKNVAAQAVRRVDMVFGISYSDDIPKVGNILRDILKEHDKVLSDPEPIVRLHALGESSLDFVVRPWVKVADYWDVDWDVTRSVKMRFDENGVSIPFPQRDVHLYPAAGSSPEPGAAQQRSA